MAPFIYQTVCSNRQFVKLNLCDVWQIASNKKVPSVIVNAVSNTSAVEAALCRPEQSEGATAAPRPFTSFREAEAAVWDRFARRRESGIGFCVVKRSLAPE
jgi:hypothetical protein